MSEEEKEAIKVLNNFNATDCGIEDTQAIETILNLIEKQQKEIEALKKENLEIRDWKYTIDTIEDLDKLKELDLIKIKGKEYISKDKIKTKILECREILYSFEKELELKANKDKFIHKESMNCLLGQISILQSLLEKE